MFQLSPQIVQNSDTKIIRVAAHLAEQFLEWQRLRKQVYELEQSLASGLRQDAPCAPKNGARRRE